MSREQSNLVPDHALLSDAISAMLRPIGATQKAILF